jgi:hypothetical protein
MYLCGSRKKKITVKQRNRDRWYGRPESLLAQTLQKLQKTGKKTSLLKIPKNTPRNPRDFPVWSRIGFLGVFLGIFKRLVFFPVF